MSDASAFALHPQSESSGVAPQNDCSDTRLHWALHDGRRGPGRLQPGPDREVRGGSHSSPLLPPHGLIPCSLHVTCPWATSSLVTVSRQGFDSHAGGFWCHMGVGMSRGVTGGIINGSPGSR